MLLSMPAYKIVREDLETGDRKIMYKNLSYSCSKEIMAEMREAVECLGLKAIPIYERGIGFKLKEFNIEYYAAMQDKKVNLLPIVHKKASQVAQVAS